MKQKESPKNPQKGPKKAKKNSAMVWLGFEPQTLQNFEFDRHMT